MGYLTDGLTFNNLREANKARLPQFKNAKGEPAHEKEDGSDLLSLVAPSEWGRSFKYSRYLAKVTLLADHTWEVEYHSED